MMPSNHHQHQRLLVQGCLFLTALMSLVTCPHSKVEESFPLQATHDLFYYGLTPAWQLRVMDKNNNNNNNMNDEVHVSSSSSSSDASSGSLLRPTPLLPYDHLQFPGVVPRSFIGPWILALICQGLRLKLWFVVDLAQHPMMVQFLARFILLLFSVHGWYRLADAADYYHYQYQKKKEKTKDSTPSSSQQQTGEVIGNYLLLVTACQFHMPFYASRMLPNTFATIVCMHAFSSWMYGNVTLAAVGLVTATAVFRCDVLLLLAVVGLIWLLYPPRPLSLWQAIRIGVCTGVACLVCTVPLDSLLWQQWVWPEGQVFYYNTILGKSSNWGVSAWHWYWTVAIPKSMLLTALFVPFSILRLPERLDFWERRFRGHPLHPSTTAMFIPIMDAEWFPFVLSAIGFVGLYSGLGHKEMRFLFPVMPLWNLAAAVGMSRFHALVFGDKTDDKRRQNDPQRHQPRRTVISILGLVAAAGALVLGLAASCSFVAVSRWNYPGGAALQKLQDHVVSSTTMAATENDASLSPLKVHVYIDVASAMTGVSLFGQHAAELAGHGVVAWSFDKKGYESENAASTGSHDWSGYTHILTEDPDLTTKNSADGSSRLFRRVTSIQGHPRLDWRSGGRIVTSNAIYILEQEHWIKDQLIANRGSNTRTIELRQQEEQEQPDDETPSIERIEL